MFHLGWFLGNGYAIQPWVGETWAGRNGYDWMRPDLYQDMAGSLERAGFDYILIEDTVGIDDTYGSSLEAPLRIARQVPKNDPVPLVPLMTQRTRHIGVAVTMSSSFYHPYMAARAMTTLDHLTEGRAAVNVVTSVNHRAAQNFGLDQHYEHDLRYEMAQEWLDATTQLWDSWEPGAVLVDEDAGVYADHTKVHVVDFQGKFFKTRGPLNTMPGPQGRPVIVQAGNSGPGRDLAARFAETMLAHGSSVEQMKAFREDMHRRMALHGRKPGDCKIMFLLSPILGESNEIAREKERLMMLAGKTPGAIETKLWNLSYQSGGEVDFSTIPLDEPMPEIVGNGEVSTIKSFVNFAQGKTLREALETFRFAGGIDAVGSPDTVAAIMGEVMDEVGGDGFLLYPKVTRHALAEIADGLAPALRKRGLIRDGYSYSTLRENLLEF
ncbi:NtaA/DmoA family FMN-dependent monooxygenase [Mycolicibacterium palauense]|uniref:NtaA/DmoA family FMN-dependent monooxygenase n=1 Tax=Mycolicibacterium palauense TaxID=2034511 RepID=UPI000BFEFC72|nr:NtaA/DmoA family FMN-dependent monooxygenase [Mycolicibacterium palauense]